MQLHLLRLYNYFYFSLLAIFISFLPVYYAEKGRSPAEVGIVLAIAALVGILSQGFWGIQSDRFKTVKKIILVALGVCITVGAVTFRTSTYGLAVVLASLLEFFLLPIDPLTESLNYRIAEVRGVSYGSVRMYGSIGYASTSLVVGLLLNHFGIDSLSWIFVIYGVLTFLISLCLPDAPTTSKTVSFRALGAFIKYPKTISFFVLVVLTAIPQRTNDGFLGVYIQSLGGSVGLVGFAWFLASASETVSFALSFTYLRRGNEWKLITIASALFALRFFLSAWISNPTWIIVVQLLHGCTFVVFYSAAISYLYAIVPEEWRSTGQTLLSLLFFGVSGIIGSMLGGFIFNAFGGAALYLSMAGLSLACATVSGAGWLRGGRRLEPSH